MVNLVLIKRKTSVKSIVCIKLLNYDSYMNTYLCTLFVIYLIYIWLYGTGGGGPPAGLPQLGPLPGPLPGPTLNNAVPTSNNVNGKY